MNRLLLVWLVPFVGVVHAQSAPAPDKLAARVKAMAEIPSTYGALLTRGITQGGVRW